MKTLEKLNVLVADDDLDSIVQIKMYLENMGCSVFVADGQKDAESFLMKKKPDLAIFDLMMENQDSGFILSYKCKEKYPDVPVIIITAVTAETGIGFGIENVEDKKWIKADLIMEKGIRNDQLKREISKLLKI